MVLHCLNHDVVLQLWVGYLQQGMSVSLAHQQASLAWLQASRQA